MIRDPIAILDRCPAVKRMTTSVRAEFVEKVRLCAIDSYAVGHATTEAMEQAGLFEFFDDDSIVKTLGLAINRQRAMCLTSEAAHAMRKGLKDTAQKKKEEAVTKQVAAAARKASKQVVEAGGLQSLPGPPPATVIMCGRGACTKAKSEDWSGCPVQGCTVWHCNSCQTCKNDHAAHKAHHLAIVAANL
jgi:hypothetical protein